MAEQTLLTMVQNILSAMSSDEVNSIGDTTESLQVANIVQNKYYDILTRGGLPEDNQLFQLDPSVDSTKPVLMFVPDGCSKINWIKYLDTNPLDSQSVSQFGSFSHDLDLDIVPDAADTVSTPVYKYVTILPLEQFLEMVNGFSLQDSNVASFTFTEDGKSFTFYYKNDHQPCYCTVISNSYIIFDSFDNTQDTTLQASKTMCFGQVVPPFSLTDNFIPALDDNKFPLLLNEAKALAFYELKQQPHVKAEQEIKRQWSTVQKNKSVSNKPGYFDQLPNFARMPRTGGYGGQLFGPRSITH